MRKIIKFQETSSLGISESRNIWVALFKRAIKKQDKPEKLWHQEETQVTGRPNVLWYPGVSILEQKRALKGN
jgi:hypothetical protein